jgi:hypothetical protein
VRALGGRVAERHLREVERLVLVVVEVGDDGRRLPCGRRAGGG